MPDLTAEYIIFLLVALVLGAGVAWLIMARKQRALTAGHESAIHELNADLDQSRAQYADTRNLLDQTAQKLALLEQSHGSLSAEKQSLESKNDTLREQYETVIRTESSLKQREESLSKRLEQLSDDLQKQSLEIDNWRTRFYNKDNEYANLQASHKEKLAAFEELKNSFEQAKTQMRVEFQNLAQQVLEEKGKAFSQTSQSSLESLLRPFREQIDSFQKRVNDVHDASERNQSRLLTEINQVRDIGIKMSDEANNLTTALKGDKKTTGNWGEIQLERSLQDAGLTKGENYEAQATFRDEDGNRRQPDFIIKLPDGKHMVIDSKVSLVDYERSFSAETEAERQAAMQAHVQAVRNHIDDLAGKDYSNLIGMRSPNFVLMFMPIEPAYIEAMKQNRGLFDYGYQKNVIMVSHTTLMPILRTVANLWMVAKSNEQAKAISDMAGDIYNQVALVAERLNNLGNSLGAVANHYNKTVTAVAGQQGLFGKVRRFSELSTRANKKMPELEPKHLDLEVHRLQAVLPDDATASITHSADGASADDDSGAKVDSISKVDGGSE